MSSKKKKGNSKDGPPEIRNAKAHRNYAVEERFEAGVVLQGTEVKSIRLGKAQINEAFCRVERGDVWLYHAHIDEYAFGNTENHNPVRPRKLLLRQREIDRLKAAIERGGYALIPLRLYFKQALVKVEIGLGKGKKLHDKREDVKRKTQEREACRVMSARNR